MAVMIPETPRSFSKSSLEDLMFNALESLPNDYYVFHSFRVVTADNGQIKESETDFIVFNRVKGILCIEAKAGHVKYKSGTWYYGSGIQMSYDGPYNQAAKNKWVLKDYIRSSQYPQLLKKCKLLHAVWFPSVDCHELLTEVLPPEADREITLTKDALYNPKEEIDRIFALSVASGTETLLSEKEKEVLLKKILCPSCDLVPSITFETDLNKQIFHKLLEEQKCVLNFLTEQRSAVIQGVAGTGKTLIALEKARRHADCGERVLFLCYNKYLQEYLSKNNTNDKIDIYTIDGYACKLSNTSPPDYKVVKAILEDFYLQGGFPYNHVIIDEGQDFGQEELEENNIVLLLSDIINESEQGSLYIFYDSMQLVQGKKIPDFIMNADCKLTLYKNCRNTENIAKTSLKPLRIKRPKLIEGCISGTIPKVYFCDSVDRQLEVVDSLIKEYRSHGMNIVLLTCKTEATSVLTNHTDRSGYRGCKFTTCRKFKGLEADAVVLLDVDKSVLLNDAAKVFYVGASRARFRLDIVTSLDAEESAAILKSFKVDRVGKNPQKRLATELNALYKTQV